jgi:hypothetical protein
MMALIVAPILLLVAAVKILERHDYPAGDIRNEPLFWIVVGVAMLILVGALVVGSIRALTRDEVRDRSDA